jgi:hypothetical protein
MREWTSFSTHGQRSFCLASAEVARQIKKFSALDDDMTNPLASDLAPELKHRKEMITKADGIKASAKICLEKLKERCTKTDQESADMRKKISDYIATVFPGVKDDLIRIEAHISSEVISKLVRS